MTPPRAPSAPTNPQRSLGPQAFAARSAPPSSSPLAGGASFAEILRRRKTEGIVASGEHDKVAAQGLAGMEASASNERCDRPDADLADPAGFAGIRESDAKTSGDALAQSGAGMPDGALVCPEREPLSRPGAGESAAPPIADLFARFVGRASLGGDGERAAMKLDLVSRTRRSSARNQGDRDGQVIVTAVGDEVEIDLVVPAGIDAGKLERRVAARLAGKGISITRFDVR